MAFSPEPVIVLDLTPEELDLMLDVLAIAAATGYVKGYAWRRRTPSEIGKILLEMTPETFRDVADALVHVRNKAADANDEKVGLQVSGFIDKLAADMRRYGHDHPGVTSR